MQRTAQHPEGDLTFKAVSRSNFLQAAHVGVIAAMSGAAPCECPPTAPTPTASLPTPKPKRDGKLRTALTGGTSAATLNVNGGEELLDNCRPGNSAMPWSGLITIAGCRTFGGRIYFEL